MDNVAITPGSGETIAADEVGGAKHQRVKISLGANGTAVDAGAGAGAVGTDTQRVTLGSDDPAVVSLAALDDLVLAEDAAASSGDKGIMALVVRRDTAAASGADGDYVTLSVDSSGRLWVSPVAAGDVAHDGADSGNPVKVGHKAIAHGTNPTAVAAGDRTDSYANRAGIPFVIGGHPNVITRSATIDDADGAQTNASLLTVSAGSKIVVTSVSASCASSNSGAVAVRIGFATATLGAASESGTDGILLEGNFAAGGGHQRGNGAGILGIGADNEDLRITCDDPAGGALYVTFSYYTIES
jgi:hypothetical protein